MARAGHGAKGGRRDGGGEESRTSLWAETHWLGLDMPATNEGPQRKEDQRREEELGLSQGHGDGIYTSKKDGNETKK